jgi:hypothetical protein
MTRTRRVRLARTAAVSAGLWLALLSAGLIGPGGAVAAPAPSASPGFRPSRCVPQRQYWHCLRYGFTGDDEVFTVPGGVRRIGVLEWGAGGGGTAGRPQFGAGAGGFAVGDVAVRPGAQLTVSVGQGGYAGGAGFGQYIYGGGGLGGNGRNTGGSGGGMSALWQGAYATTPILIAGGGGGASPGSQTVGSAGRYPAVIGGGGGGGLTGGSDGTRYSGQGGTQYGPGDPGGPPGPCDGSGIGGTAPTPGQQYNGGNGAGSDPDPPGRGVVAAGGGGGGGGYFGGGGGTCQVYVTGDPNGAGGGGSGYFEVGTVSHGRTVAGRDGTAAGLDRSARPAAAAMRSPFYRPGIGWGGGGSGAANGGNGQIVIEWGARPEAGKGRLHRTRLHRTRLHRTRLHRTRLHGTRARPAPHSRPAPRPRPTPAPLAGPPSQGALPRSGFPLAQVGMVALVLIGLGVIVTRTGGRCPER